MNAAIILGTRPEIIKMSPIIRACEGIMDFFILHTGQHYSYQMDNIFFEELNLPEPKYNLKIGSCRPGMQIGKMILGIEKILNLEMPDVILVQGDTNSTLSGAIAGSKSAIRIGHIEAGMRSYNRQMPEEINRILVDHISDYLFPSNALARDVLLGEGIPSKRILLCGNTLTETIHQNLDISRRKYCMPFGQNPYILVTIHRQENVDSRQNLNNILLGLDRIYKEFDIPVIFPIHPRTKKNIQKFNLSIPLGVDVIDPIGYLEFLQIEKSAKLILTDSGGVQQEACILGVPCVTLRHETEWVETLDVNSNMLAGNDPGAILKCSKIMLGAGKSWSNPFGDLPVAKRMVNALCSI